MQQTQDYKQLHQHSELSKMSEEELTKIKKREQIKYKTLCLHLAQSQHYAEKFQFALRLMRMFPQDRFEEENQILLQATSDMKFFSELNSKKSSVTMKLHEQCCQKMTYVKFSRGQTVFYQGDIPEQFYIILSGSVNVMIQKDLCTLQEEQTSDLENKEKERWNSFHQNNKQPFDKNDFEKMQRDNHGWNQATLQMGGICLDEIDTLDKYLLGGLLRYKYLLTLTEGMMFGDLGLLLRKPRAATIICKQDCEFATLTAEHYQKILKGAKLQKMNNQIQFFQQAMLQTCPIELVTRFIYFFEKKKIYKDTVIYKQNDNPNGIYLIKSGVVQLIRSVEEPSELSKIRDQQKIYDQTAFLKVCDKRHDSLVQQKKMLGVPLTEIGRGNTFGDYETLFGCKRMSTAICISDSVVIWTVSKNTFQSLINDNPEIVRSLKELAQTKEEFFQHRVEMWKKQKIVNLKQVKVLTKPLTDEIEYIKECDNLLPGGAWQTVCRTNNNLKNLKKASQKQQQDESNQSDNLDIFSSMKQIHADKIDAQRVFRNKITNYNGFVNQTVKPLILVQKSPKVQVESINRMFPANLSLKLKMNDVSIIAQAQENRTSKMKSSSIQERTQIIQKTKQKPSRFFFSENYSSHSFLGSEFKSRLTNQFQLQLSSYGLANQQPNKEKTLPSETGLMIRKLINTMQKPTMAKLNVTRDFDDNPPSVTSRRVITQSKHNMFRQSSKREKLKTYYM